MPETTTERAICAECGSDIRENTQFCYNCGKPVEEAVASSTETDDIVSKEGKSALDNLAEKLKADEESNEKLAKAAAVRKKSRVGQRRSKKIIWEPDDESRSGLVLILAAVIGLLALFIVVITVYWK